MGFPTIYPTGTTIYNPEKCFNGFTLYPATNVGAVLVDMNGREVNIWKDFDSMPNKLLKGGYVMGASGVRNPNYMSMEYIDLVQVDWDGNIVWKFDHLEYIEDPGEEPRWMARQKGDYQREGNPVGYYSPELECKTDSGNTLILCHRNVTNPKISLYPLIDDTIIEVDWEGNIIWEWRCSDHFREMNFSEEAKNAIFRDPNLRLSGLNGMGDWMHINNFNVLGPNKWYDEGDERFHPDNIIWDGREANISAIISKKTGKIVWQLGPDYTDKKYRHIGPIIGQHHVHMIPKGLPGAGNIMIFNNGGQAGYGAPTPNSPAGFENSRRDYSRVLEIDPITLKIAWKYTPKEAGGTIPINAARFYSAFISSAQRLPNGNTLITEGASGRLFEVTPDYEIVWEYINPHYAGASKKTGLASTAGVGNNNRVYRAYRVPYDYCPQAGVPEKVPVVAVSNADFRMPGAAPRGAVKLTTIEGVIDPTTQTDVDNFCLATEEQKIEMKKLGIGTGGSVDADDEE